MRSKGTIYMILAALCLGLIGVSVKAIGNDVPIMTINFLRVFLGFLFLAATTPFIDKNTFRIKKTDLKGYIITGALLAVALSLYTAANIFAPVQNAVLINYTYPFFVLIFAWFLLKENITSQKIITLIIAFIGLAFINPFQQGTYTTGNLLSLGGALVYGLLIAFMRKEDQKHDIGDVTWFLGIASVLLLPFAIAKGFGTLTGNLIPLAILGLISTGAAYLFYNLALKSIEAENAAMTATIITPLTSIMLAVILLNESLTGNILVGGGLIVAAGFILQIHRKSPLHKGHRPAKRKV